MTAMTAMTAMFAAAVDNWIGLGLGVALVGYLVIALVKPERF